jgi:hypothetical protein
MNCPKCKGSGEIEITCSEYGKKGIEKFSLPCIYCDGKGEITKKEFNKLKAEKALWCSCGNPSQETRFWDDGQHPNCPKHCYTCKDCKKIIQVG